jgi:hypothetical protein
MKIFLRFAGSLFLGAVLVMGGALPADSQNDRVRAKIGIMVKSGDKVMRAKKKGRIRSGDRIRIYAIPEKPSYVYIVHTDMKTATLLNDEKQQIENEILTLPSLQGFYEIDGKSAKETITIVCSPDKPVNVPELLKSGQASHSAWAALEKELIEKSRIDLTHKAEKPFTIAGNVRGAGGAADPFVAELKTVSGKSLVVRKYEFRVKK